MSDEHYTPQPIYDLILKHFQEQYGIQKDHIVRPFYPGGDYQSFPYKEGDLVFDNPPFSIFREIIPWYDEHNIRYVLFYDEHVCLTSQAVKHGIVFTGKDLKYCDGLRMSTCFVTNLFDDIYLDNDLSMKLSEYYGKPAKIREVDWYTPADLEIIARRQNVKIPRSAIKDVCLGGTGGKCYGGGIYIPDGIDQFKERGKNNDH